MLFNIQIDCHGNKVEGTINIRHGMECVEYLDGKTAVHLTPVMPTKSMEKLLYFHECVCLDIACSECPTFIKKRCHEEIEAARKSVFKED